FGGQWIAVQPLLEATRHLQPGSGGTAWTIDRDRRSVRHWDGSRWLKYQLGDAYVTTIVTRKDDVWAVTDRGAARFDGRNFRFYPEATDRGPADAIAIGPSGVWVLADSILSYFDGRHWAAQNLKDTPAGSDWQKHAEQDTFEMRATEDG